MICPECHGETDDRAVSCAVCGASTPRPIDCRRCHTVNLPDSRFCDRCGNRLDPDGPSETLKSERKHVTVLFSDISRYPEIVHRADPEDVRQLTRYLFEEMVKIIERYEGYVDRILWDGVLAVFGMPHAHEDDAVRAIRAALEIHRMVCRMERRPDDASAGPLAMRSGVASGLVVTGSTEKRTGRHGLTGDTVNLAARLRDLAGAGEVLVDGSAFSAAAGFFHFDPQPAAMVKGRVQPLAVYRVRAPVPQPEKVRRIHGLTARLIGRDRELRQLGDAAMRLHRGEGTVVTVCGDAGTGKSRLIAEFKASSDMADLCWLDGHAYTYNQGIPYYPFIDMLNRRFNILDEDSGETVQAKLRWGIGPLVEHSDGVIPYLAGLYAGASSEALAMGPEVYKSHLQGAFTALLSALARRGPTVVCIEDLHWADPSSLALIRHLLEASALPMLFVISHRPAVEVVEESRGRHFSYAREAIRLADLSTVQAREMVRSMMETDTLPQTLERHIVERVEGNPFYLEEVINSLVDARRLKRVGGKWHLDESVDISGFSSTINGMIHGRLDRLGAVAKSVLKEASVIGRVFRLSLLGRVTAHPQALVSALAKIEGVGLIHRKEDRQEPTFSFKHAIVQEVVYQGLLKGERRAIHEKIARNLEGLFDGRLDSVVETLALHYANSDCTAKAAEFLIRSGEKSMARYAVEESHRYYERAYRLLSRIPAPGRDEQALLIDLLIKWYFAFNKRGLFREMLDLLRQHESLAQAFDDPLKRGMYDVCMGWALQRRELVADSYTYLARALRLGRVLGDDNLIAYSSACLCWTCTDLGRMDEGLAFGREAAAVAERIGTDHELIRFNLTGMGLLHFFSGDVAACWQTGHRLMQFGETAGDIRTFSEGYLLMGSARMAAGDFSHAETLLTQAIESAVDPIYGLNARFFLSYVYFSQGKIPLAARTLEAVIADTDRFGYEYVGTSANAFYGVVTAAMGNLEKGVAIIRERIASHRRRGKSNHDLIFTHMLGRFYLSLVRRSGPWRFRHLVRNAGFLLRTWPRAGRLAERYLREAVDLGTRIGARLRVGQACLDLGWLYLRQKRWPAARGQIARSIELFEGCGALPLLEEARTAWRWLPAEEAVTDGKEVQ